MPTCPEKYYPELNLEVLVIKSMPAYSGTRFWKDYLEVMPTSQEDQILKKSI